MIIGESDESMMVREGFMEDCESGRRLLSTLF